MIHILRFGPNFLAEALYKFAADLNEFKYVQGLKDSGIRYDSTGDALFRVNTNDVRYNLTFTSDDNGGIKFNSSRLYAAVKVDPGDFDLTAQKGDVTSSVIDYMLNEAAQSVVADLVGFYPTLGQAEDTEKAFELILDSIREIGTGTPSAFIDSCSLPSALRQSYINTFTKCSGHMDATLQAVVARCDSTHPAAGSLYDVVKQEYESLVPEHATGDIAAPKKTFWQTIRRLPGKIRRNYQLMILGGAFALAVASAGCVDSPAKIQDKVDTHVYMEMGGDENPDDKIREFYIMANNAGGPPTPEPVEQYPVIIDADGNITILDPDTDTPLDPDDMPEGWEDLLVKDDAGNVITDPGKLDIHIKPTGENKYEICNMKQELQVEDGVWKVVGYPGYDDFDEKLVDNEIAVGDNIDEMYGALVRGSDGSAWGVIFVNRDVFDMYGEDFGIKARGVNPIGILKNQCTEVAPGLYVYLYDLSQTPEGSATVHSPFLLSEEVHIADDNHGKYAQFRFVKE